MKFGIKYKLLLAFVCVLVVTTSLNAAMASYLTNEQSKDKAYDQLSRQVILLQNELQALQTDLLAVSVATANDEKILTDLSTLYGQSLQVDQDPSLRAPFGINKAASLNRLQLILRSSGFSSAAIYLENELSHYITQNQAGMLIIQDDGQPVLIHTETEGEAIDLSTWRNWSTGAPPSLIPSQMPQTERMDASFIFPNSEATILQIVIPIQGVVEFYVSGTFVKDMSIATPETLQAERSAGETPTVVGILVFNKVFDRAFLEETASKTGLFPALFSPDGRHQQQLIDSQIPPEALRELVNAANQGETNIRQQLVEGKEGSYYQVLMPWLIQDEPILVLGFALSQAGTLSDIRQTVVGIAGVSSLILIIGAVAVYFLLRSLVKPIENLTAMAQRVASGDLEIKVPVKRKDETGQLATAFNSMTAQLRDLIGTLEQRVKERTQELARRSTYLEASAEVGRAATLMLDTDELVHEVARLIRQRFDLYYVGLFQVDAAGEWAVLRAGAGRTAGTVLAPGYRQKIGEGIIGWSIEHATARVAQVAEEDELRLKITELPATRSEAAIPLRSRGQILGALSVQSDQPEAFDETTLSALQTMADQVAVAIDNARLFAASQTALEAERRAYGELSRQDWARLLKTRTDWGYHYIEGDITPAAGDWQPEMKQAAKERRVIQTNDDTTPTVAIPLQVREQVIGVLNFRKADANDDWTDQEIALLQTLVEQIGPALESARLYQDTQRRAVQEQMVSEIAARMRETMDMDTILQTAVREMRQSLNVARVEARLVAPTEKEQHR